MFTCDHRNDSEKRDEGTEDTQQTDSDRDSHRFHRPEVITQVCHNLHPDTFVHLPHLLGAELRDPNTHCVILPLSAYHNGRACRQRLFSRRQIPSSGCQSRTHHVCTANQESDGTSVHPDRRQDVRIWCNCVRSPRFAAIRSFCMRTFMDHPQCWVERPIKMLKEQGFALHSVYRKVVLAGRISSSHLDASDSIEMNTDHFT
jgi:hypothetical protein